MRSYTYETVVAVPPSQLYAALIDIPSWPAWDAELERAEHDGVLAPGAPFRLRPKGGPNVKMTVECAEPDACFADISHLPLAKMRTRHEFLPASEGSRVRVRIEVWGVLGFLWDRLVARKQAAGLAEQTRAFARYAQARR